MDNLLEVIRESWGWTGLEPADVVAENSFGNVIAIDIHGNYWRICPEECYRKKIAETDEGFSAVATRDDFREDWEMERIVQVAQQTLGPPSDGRCYCLKLPAPLGGVYDATNYGTVSRTELISFSGSIAEQMKDVPNGSEVKIEFIR